MCAVPSCTTCASVRASRRESRKSSPEAFLAPEEAAREAAFLFASESSMALSFNPQEMPILGVDNHLPAIRPEELRADALRRRFQSPPTWSPEIAVERRFNDRELTHASVL